MIVEYTVTHVEMIARPPAPQHEAPDLVLTRPEPGAADEELRDTLRLVGAPYRWSSAGRSDEAWREWLGNSVNQRWLFRERVTGETVGFLELAPQQEGSIEIVAFGLVPEVVGDGRKYGRQALELAVEQAWDTHSLDGPARRIWLHTSSRDHPSALRNYLGRGFKVFKAEQKSKDVALPPVTTGHLAFLDGFREMGQSPGKAVYERDALLLCYPGTPDSKYFNTMFRTRPVLSAADAVRAGDDFFSQRSRGYSIVACRGTDDDLIEYALALGATYTVERLPLMGCAAPVPMPAVPAGIEIRPLAEGGEHEFVDLACAIFDSTDEARAVSRVVLDDASAWTLPHRRALVAYEGGEPVGIGASRLSHGIGYVTWIGTLPAVRRRGLGAALTAQLTNDAFALGAAEVWLDASVAGEPLYRRLGFVEQAEYARLYRALG